MSMKNVLCLLVGAAAGSLVAVKLVKDKYKKYADEEIQSVKDTLLGKKEEEIVEEKEIKVVAPEKFKDVTSIDNASVYPTISEEPDELDNYHDLASEYDYNNETSSGRPKVTDEEAATMRPYVIDGDLFGDDLDYATISLTYFDDGVLADDDDEIIEDIDDIIGIESLKHFGESEPDMLYVQNDKYRCYYEVCIDVRTYDEYIRTRRPEKRGY